MEVIKNWKSYLIAIFIGIVIAIVSMWGFLNLKKKEMLVSTFDWTWRQFQTSNPAETGNIPSGIMTERYKRARIDFNYFTFHKYMIITGQDYEFETNSNMTSLIDKKITSVVGFRFTKSRHTGGLNYGTYHYGVDIAMKSGTPIKPFQSGVVIKRGYDQDGFGYYVIIQDMDNRKYIYGHFKKLLCKRKQNVDTNTVIGLCGNTGNSRGSHLHYQQL